MGAERPGWRYRVVALSASTLRRFHRSGATGNLRVACPVIAVMRSMILIDMHDRKPGALGDCGDDQVDQPDAPLMAGAAGSLLPMDRERSRPVDGRRLEDSSRAERPVEPVVFGKVPRPVEVLEEDGLGDRNSVSPERIRQVAGGGRVREPHG